ncbi:MAG: class I SAM-dependent methyltransferase [Fidelibacterota bacterium]|nr:MAG: class I SAM-dependent methyltransferase [Candidatus Neomarinimicrobiota bacterium]
MGDNTFSFDAFAQHAFYNNVIRQLVTLANLKPGQRVMDLGAGTGAVTRLLVDKVAGQKGAEVIAVEPSSSALEIARQNLADIRGTLINFVQSKAEQLTDIVSKPMDAIFFCNAIHLVKEKARVVEEIWTSLRKGGVFTFNTTFFEGAEPPESQQFYKRWMLRALRLLKGRYDLSPTREKAEARQRLSEAEYEQLVQDHGFNVKSKEMVRVEMPMESFEDISGYELWIRGILPGIPLDIGAKVLKDALAETATELGLAFSPRNWLLMVAQKT